MVVDYLHIVGVAVPKAKAEAQVPTHVDSVESLVFGFEPVQAEAGQAQLLDGGCPVEQLEQATDLRDSCGRQATVIPPSKPPGGATAEGANPHRRMLASRGREASLLNVLH